MLIKQPRKRRWTLRAPSLYKGAVRVVICRDHETWRQEVNRIQPDVDPMAIGVCFAATRNQDKAPCALVILDGKQVGAGYVTHELMHASLWLLGGGQVSIIGKALAKAAKPKKADGHLTKAGEHEERLCSIIEYLTRAFWYRWFRFVEKK